LRSRQAGRSRPPAIYRLLPIIRENKPGIVAALSSARMLESEVLRETFEERAAILQFDGGLSRDEAERAAWALVSRRQRLH
jgi:hypothetical protein